MSKLTKREIEKAKYQGKEISEGKWSRDFRWDNSIKGLGLRIYPTGEKAFVLSYRFHGRKRLMTLGPFGVLTVDQARDMARLHLAEILKGIDPLEKREQAARGETVKDLCEMFIERHSKVHKKTWKDDEYRIEKHIKPAWGSLKASSITSADVSALHTKIGRDSGHYEANRVVELISKIWERAEHWGGFVLKGSPNPARGIEKFKERKRDRWVTPEELPALATAINQEENIYIKAALWLYLLTGTRKSELLKAKWVDVDLVRQELRLPETKAGRIHYVPLSEPAVRILRALPRQKDNPFVFCGRKEGGRIVEIRKAWVRVRKAAKLPDVRLHDLRRTVGSWLVGSGASLPLVGKILNHSNPSTTQRYAWMAEDHARRALEDHAQRLLTIAEKGNGE